MNGCTPDAPIPARTWVWTHSNITLGPVPTDPDTHGFVYLNHITGGCSTLLDHIADVLRFKKNNNNLKTGGIQIQNVARQGIKFVASQT